MNLKKFYKLVTAPYKRISFEIKEETKDSITFTSNLSVSHYDDDILLRVIAHNDGTVHVFYVFDKLELTPTNMELVNEFNSGDYFMSAAISEKNGGTYLEFHGRVVGELKDLKRCVETTQFFIDRIANEKVAARIKPLAERTHQ